MMNTESMPVNEHVPHALFVLVQLLDVPARRVDCRHDVDVHGSRARVEPETRIDLARNLEVERDDRRPQARGQVKGSLVEGADLAGRDASAFRTQIDRFTGPPQHTI